MLEHPFHHHLHHAHAVFHHLVAPHHVAASHWLAISLHYSAGLTATHRCVVGDRDADTGQQSRDASRPAIAVDETDLVMIAYDDAASGTIRLASSR